MALLLAVERKLYVKRKQGRFPRKEVKIVKERVDPRIRSRLRAGSDTSLSPFRAVELPRIHVLDAHFADTR